MLAEPAAEPLPQDPFVHLHTHTEYSLLDGAARINELVGEAARLGQPAVSITDHGVLYGAVEFVAAAKGAGVKPIIGCEVYMAPRSRHDKEGRADRDPNHLILLARDNTGYRNLVTLVSKSHLEGYYYKPRIDKELLAEHSEGLMCLSACIGGELPQAILRGGMDAAEAVARQHMEIFGPDNYFLELQEHGIPEETQIREGLVEIARRTGLPMVCTNDSHYIRSEDAEAHDILLCLQTGARRQDEKRFKFSGPHFYLAGGEEMRGRFAQYTEAAANTLYVAERCNVEMQLGQTLLPRYEPIPEGMDAVSYLRHLCEEGLHRRYGASPSAEAWDRLKMELDVIEETGFAAYFLIVWDFMRAARCDGVKVGPGRGSAAGSLVAYVLEITNLDPLKYNLLFERFLNRERVSMPDIDCDFDDRRRDRVLSYVQRKYGTERVAQIITFGTMAARAAIRDVGRVLDVPLTEVDRLAKLVPQSIGITLEQALQQSRELREVYENEPWAAQVIDNARRLEGICRNASTHAAGVVIAPEPLANIVPLQRSTSDRESIVTQFDMNGVQKIGLLKMDFLGLSNLTIIDEALQFIKEKRGEDIDLDALPLDDENTYALFGRADTHGIFQFEGSGAKKVLIDMQPQTLDDLSAANGLNRPGPIEGGVIDMYMKRKRGEEPIDYLPGLADKLHPILAETYGTIIYQEQVMRIAQAVAGFSLAEADILRAAMGKKDQAKMDQQRAKFLAGAAERGTTPEVATELFDLIARFAKYGFNKCLAGDTIVMDAHTGERTTVRDLYRDRRAFTVHSVGDDGVVRPRPVTDVVSNGRKPLFTVRTAQGHRIRATATHRFRTFEGWTRLEDLRVGDRVAVAASLPVSTTHSWPEHEIVTLAGLLAEGNTCHPTCLYFYNNNPDIIDDFAAAVARFPHTVGRISTRGDGRMEVCASTGRDARFRAGQRPWNAVMGATALAVEETPLPKRSGAFEWARALGLLGVKATDKRVPEAVFTLRDDDVALFLGRLWAGDGYIASAGSAGRVPFYATSSPGLARDVQYLLLRLGINSGIHTKRFHYRGGEREGYTVHLVGEGSIERFVEQVAWHCVGRQDDVARLIAHLDGPSRGASSKDTIPMAVAAVVDEERNRAELSWRDLEVRSGRSMSALRSADARKRGMQRRVVADVAEALGSKRLSQIAEADVLWDRIVAIELSGVEDTYDLTVDVDHNFVADGLVVHNSHSICYSLVGYQTAYLKANYPLEYMAALLNSRGGDFDKLKQTILDSRARGLDVRPPDVNRSIGGFSVGDVEKREILYGLHHIKNVGEKVIDAVLEARAEGGPFTSLLDLCERVGSRDMNRRVLEALIRSGACDCFGNDRAALLAVVDQVLDRVAQVRRERESGQVSLFGGGVFDEAADAAATLSVELHLPSVTPTPDETRLLWEKEFLGMYLSDHPLRAVEEDLRAKTDTNIAEVGSHLDGCVVQVGGSLRDVRAFVPKRSTTGKSMAVLQLEDMTGSCEVVVFASTFESCVEVLRPDKIVVVRGKVEAARSRPGAAGATPGAAPEDESGGEQPTIIAEAVYALEDVRLSTWRSNRVVHLSMNARQLGMLDTLRAALQRHGGDTQVMLHVEDHEKVIDVTLADEFCVDPSPALMREVEALLGPHALRIDVRRDRAPEREGRRTAARRT